MDQIQLVGKRDFPFTTNVLNFMQSATEALEKLAALGGDNYILSGCTVNGTSIADGWVVLGGKVMPFKAGSVQTNISIRKSEAVITVDGFSRTETNYFAEFGTTTVPGWQFFWNALPRLEHGAVKTGNHLALMLKGKLGDNEVMRIQGCEYTSSGEGNGTMKTVAEGFAYFAHLDAMVYVPEHTFGIYGEPPLPHRWKLFDNGDGTQYAELAQRDETEEGTFAEGIHLWL